MCFSNKSLGISMQILLLFSYHYSPFFFLVLRVIWLTLIHLLFNFSETTWINSICTIVVFWFRCRARGIAAEQYCFCWENNHWHQNSSWHACFVIFCQHKKIVVLTLSNLVWYFIMCTPLPWYTRQAKPAVHNYCFSVYCHFSCFK